MFGYSADFWDESCDWEGTKLEVILEMVYWLLAYSVRSGLFIYLPVPSSTELVWLFKTSLVISDPVSTAGECYRLLADGMHKLSLSDLFFYRFFLIPKFILSCWICGLGPLFLSKKGMIGILLNIYGGCNCSDRSTKFLCLKDSE